MRQKIQTERKFKTPLYVPHGSTRIDYYLPDSQGLFVTTKLGEKLTRHQCTACKYSTSIVTNMRLHIMIHTGERPYECKICRQRFRQKMHLERHTLRTHPDSTSFCVKFVCP